MFLRFGEAGGEFKDMSKALRRIEVRFLTRGGDWGIGASRLEDRFAKLLWTDDTLGPDSNQREESNFF